MSDMPRIISVDDHVVEPPTLWTDRLPASLRSVGPRVERARGRIVSSGGKIVADLDTQDGVWGDWWVYEDRVFPISQLSVAAGGDKTVLDNSPAIFDEIDPACWKQAERLAAMDRNHVEAALCFPNTLPRFCGQTFLEASDRELALLCVRAYNDWMIDEWCDGSARGRLIPLTIVPLWDVDLAAEEVRRCAAKGSHAIAFSENPSKLGMPSLHQADRYWDPLFRACEETNTVINMHIGSSSSLPSTSPDAPHVVSSALLFQNSIGSLADYLLSGVLERFPALRIAYSEAQVGWIPYLLERLDQIWHERGTESAIAIDIQQPPSSLFKGRVYGCVFDDLFGLTSRENIGMGQIMFETDFPHIDGTYPNSRETAERLCAAVGLTGSERYMLLRGNAIDLYGLERYGY